MPSAVLQRTIPKYRYNYVTGAISALGTDVVYYQSVLVPTVIRRKVPEVLWNGGTSFLAQTLTSQSDKVQYNVSYPTTQYCSAVSTRGISAASLEVLYEDDSGVLNALTVGIRGKVKDQKVNLALSIAEGRQAVSMVNSLFKDALSAYRRLRRNGLRSLRDLRMQNESGWTSAQKHAANRWLELQYGWLPTVSDIYGLAHVASEKAAVGVWQYAKVRTNVRKDLYRLSQDRETLTTGTGEQDGRAVCRYRVKNENMRLITQTGFTNPAELLWEKVPYSFVFDALVDVGSWLHGIDAFSNVEAFEVWYRVKTVANWQHVPGPSPQSRPGNMRFEFKRYRRTAPSSVVPLGRPIWNDKAPSITRLANYLSLLRQLR